MPPWFVVIVLPEGRRPEAVPQHKRLSKVEAPQRGCRRRKPSTLRLILQMVWVKIDFMGLILMWSVLGWIKIDCIR